MTAINTAKIPQRRKLRFETLDNCLDEFEQLRAAERAGRLKLLGNWSWGQNLGHLAPWIDYSFDGAPSQPAWFIKPIMKLFVGKTKFVNQPMPAGVKIPGMKGGTLATDPISTEEGEHRFIAAIDRLRRSAPTRPHMVFGPFTHEEWIKLHLRHAELHFGFCLPG